jgi:hypothetical protein
MGIHRLTFTLMQKLYLQWKTQSRSASTRSLRLLPAPASSTATAAMSPAGPGRSVIWPLCRRAPPAVDASDRSIVERSRSPMPSTSPPLSAPGRRCLRLLCRWAPPIVDASDALPPSAPRRQASTPDRCLRVFCCFEPFWSWKVPDICSTEGGRWRIDLLYRSSVGGCF